MLKIQSLIDTRRLYTIIMFAPSLILMIVVQIYCFEKNFKASLGVDRCIRNIS